MSKKTALKGFTLIELVVAMGILVMVFSGTVTLIVAVINLAMNTRTKTEVVAIAQKGLTDSIVTFREDPINPLPTYCANTIAVHSPSYSISCTIDTPPLGSDPAGLGFEDPTFVKIKVTVAWTVRGAASPQTYTLVQAIRRNQ